MISPEIFLACKYGTVVGLGTVVLSMTFGKDGIILGATLTSMLVYLLER